MKQFLLLILACCFSFIHLKAQDASPVIARYLTDNKDKWHLNTDEAAHGWAISDQYNNRQNQITHVYVQQMVHGLKLHNAVSTAAIKNGTVVVFKSRFTPNAAGMVLALPGAQQISEQEAVLRAAESVQVTLSNIKSVDPQRPDTEERIFTADGALKSNIKVFPIYQKMADQIHLAWNVEFKSKSDGWSIRVDALSGQVLDKSNYTVYCNFGAEAYSRINVEGNAMPQQAETVHRAANLNAGESYRVFPFPGESPNHVAHQLISDPADLTASPFGWHDTDGMPGAEHTITRGNNVYACEDRDDNNTPGYSPDGGAGLVFDFPYTPNLQPLQWQDAAITNLFYANNFMHDMTYHYGFDEVSGNFQQNNYGRDGEGGDAVQADAQDGSGTNNANFGTPPDGEPGRMQMYIWSTGSSTIDSISILSPAGIAGKYLAPFAAFGPEVTSTLTSELVLVIDDAEPTSDGCSQILNGAQLAGKIAVIDRGSCNFTIKVKAAQQQGAIGVVICNNVATTPFSMPGNDATITIPSVMISQDDCMLIKNALANGPVTMSFEPSQGEADHDSDVDNGIIAHEYGHGISNRLTGGPSNVECLNNAEQMGEGWSDYYALITTIHPTDNRFTARPMGTYALGQPVAGSGIRNQIYSTDLSVCTYTYDDLPGTGGETHNIGELWTAMIWDLSWDLIDQYGYDEDIFTGTGGNNIALRLVTEGMKLQACNPGFADGRDGILAADQLFYNGANQCLIWAAFARRGLGFSASQGSSNDVDDGISGFDLPPVCQTAVLAPIAGFNVDRTSACLGLATFKFTDQSQNLAQYFLWNFGDGTTSTETNPVHEYTQAGIFTVSVKVTNNIGVDSVIMTDLIEVSILPAPSAEPATVCAGQSAELTALLSAPDVTAEWRDSSGNIIFSGATFTTPVLLNTTTFKFNEAENLPLQHVGPQNFGTGSNHNTSFVGQVLFTAEKAFTIKSALVRAQGAGNREIRIYSGSGSVLQSVTVNIPDGESRIDLNLEVPSAGEFSLGAGPNVDLYRDNAGVTYPFVIDELVTINGSNAGTAGFYYYFYDWEVQETPCRSADNSVTVTVTPGPVPNFNISLNGLIATFTDMSTGNPVTRVWDFGDGSSSDMANPVHTYAASGIYMVSLTVSDGNCTTVFTRTIDFTTGTNSLQAAPFDAQLLPNPATRQTNLSLTGTPGGRFVQVALYSVDGRLIQNNRFDLLQGKIVRLGLEGMPAGLYLVKISAENGVVVRKLAVE